MCSIPINIRAQPRPCNLWQAQPVGPVALVERQADSSPSLLRSGRPIAGRWAFLQRPTSDGTRQKRPHLSKRNPSADLRCRDPPSERRRVGAGTAAELRVGQQPRGHQERRRLHPHRQDPPHLQGVGAPRQGLFRGVAKPVA